MVDNEVVYLDNAATSFPKPMSVYNAVEKTMRDSCGNPGRSGHKLSLSAGRIIDEARMLCASLFNAGSPENIVFTNNTTTALNMAIKGILKPGDHVITSTLEHNSVARPLTRMETNGISVTKIPTDIISGINLENLNEYISSNTKLFICSHISNVTGTINNVAAIGDFCREHNIILLVDAAQSAGTRPIDVQAMQIDMMAFPGHKGLFGPQGTGGLYIKPGIELETIIEGGTGSLSESLYQPVTMPEKFESGTQNTPGLAGLAAGIRFIMETGIETIKQHESMLTNRLLEGLTKIEDIELVGPKLGTDRGSVVSIRFSNIQAADAALMLDAAFNIATRSGLHCASDAHRTAGTIECGGTLRISPGFFNTEDDINYCLQALTSCIDDI